MRHLALNFLLLSLVAGTGCSSLSPLEKQAGTGDLSFRLKWAGDADLDLHVRQPDGEEIGFSASSMRDVLYGPQGVIRRRSPSEDTQPRGLLDIDCNAAPTRMCRRPIENIYWPPTTAPEGVFAVWVKLYQPARGGGAVDYVLEIREGEEIRQVAPGSIEQIMGTSLPVSYQYQRSRATRQR